MHLQQRLLIQMTARHEAISDCGLLACTMALTSGLDQQARQRSRHTATLKFDHAVHFAVLQMSASRRTAPRLRRAVS